MEEDIKALNYRGLAHLVERLKTFFIKNPKNKAAGKYLRCIDSDGNVEWVSLPSFVNLIDGFDPTSLIIGGTSGRTLTTEAEVKGDCYIATAAGTLFPGTVSAMTLEAGDSIIFRNDVAAGTSITANDIIFIESSVSISPGTSLLSWDTEITLATVEGVAIKAKLPTNPNTDRYVNQATFADDSASTPDSPIKMTLTRAGSDTATVVANLPKVSSSNAGVVPKGNTVSTLSDTTKFLREDGSWATPSYNNYTLPTASSSTKGGIKVGDGLRIDSSDKLYVDTTVSTATISSNSTTISYDSGKYIKASVQNGDTLTINVNLQSAFSGTPYAKDVIVRITNTSSSTSSAATIKVASTGTTGTLVNMFDTRLTNNTGVSLYGSGTMELVFTFWDKNDVTFNGGEEVAVL